MRPRNVCDFLRLRNMLLKATFPTSYFGLVQATSAALKRVSAQSTAEMKLIGVSSPYQILKFAYIFIHAVGWAAIPYCPAKRCDSGSHKQVETGKCLGRPPYLPTLPRQFVPVPTLGMLRCARISTVISVPPLHPTQRLCLYQNQPKPGSRQLTHISQEFRDERQEVVGRCLWRCRNVSPRVY